jgi:hypothetical protein
MKKLYFPVFLSLIVATLISQIIYISLINNYHLPSFFTSQILTSPPFMSLFLFVVYLILELIIQFLPFICGSIVLNLFISEKQLQTKIFLFSLILGLINFCSDLGANFSGIITLDFNIPISSISESLMTFFSILWYGYIFALAIGFLIRKKRLLYSIVGLIIFFIWNGYFSGKTYIFYSSTYSYLTKRTIIENLTGISSWEYLLLNLKNNGYVFLQEQFFLLLKIEIGVFCGWLTWLKLDKINSIASFREKLYKKVGTFVHYIPADNEELTI